MWDPHINLPGVATLKAWLPTGGRQFLEKVGEYSSGGATFRFRIWGLYKFI